MIIVVLWSLNLNRNLYQVCIKASKDTKNKRKGREKVISYIQQTKSIDSNIFLTNLAHLTISHPEKAN